jgi:predicted metal-dependent HD superfamily phosphohydrolase
MLERDRFDACWFVRTGQAPRAHLFEELLAQYQSPSRHYHHAQHIAECLSLLDQTITLAEQPREVELALWFHDAIYDARAKDNEEQSAAWAARELQQAYVDTSTIMRIEVLILATKHNQTPASRDAQLIVDIDLSILGSDPTRFDEYDKQIRAEYDWVPVEAYCQGRTAVLRQFLNRPSIYSLPWFQERFEAKARDNIARAIARLNATP